MEIPEEDPFDYVPLSAYKPSHYSDSNVTSDSEGGFVIDMIRNTEQVNSALIQQRLNRQAKETEVSQQRKNETSVTDPNVATPKWKNMILSRRQSHISLTTDSMDALPTEQLINNSQHLGSQEPSTPRTSVSSIQFSSPVSTPVLSCPLANPFLSPIAIKRKDPLTDVSKKSEKPQPGPSNESVASQGVSGRSASASTQANQSKPFDKPDGTQPTTSRPPTIESIEQEAIRSCNNRIDKLKTEGALLDTKVKELYESLKREKVMVAEEKKNIPKAVLDHFFDYDSEKTDDEDISGGSYDRHVKMMEFQKRKAIYRKKRSLIMKWVKVGREIGIKEEKSKEKQSPSTSNGNSPKEC